MTMRRYVDHVMITFQHSSLSLRDGPCKAKPAMKSWMYFALNSLLGRFLSYGPQSSRGWEDLSQYQDMLRSSNTRIVLYGCS
ncbi:hypothetical protein Ac2012v2_000847 [Leucoagaricus gongylophorus]